MREIKKALIINGVIYCPYCEKQHDTVDNMIAWLKTEESPFKKEQKSLQAFGWCNTVACINDFSLKIKVNKKGEFSIINNGG